MIFKSENEFEEAMIKALRDKGWGEFPVIKYPTEEDLINNWANILFKNNSGIDRLNDVPLTKTEMQQIMEKIQELRTPIKLNGFINGKTISIKRDNPEDKLHLGKEVSLKIYDRHEIAAGQSRYQIAQQPIFKAKSDMLNDRRGDFVLLINGMPVIHVELKKDGIPISQAYHQIEKYSHEGIFTGLFSLVQIFVAMTPTETVYFANPGVDGKFNPNFYFHWADFNNNPVNHWVDITKDLLSIPMAHQLIGFYTIPDDSDGVLKVMRSYQYYAANKISDKVSKINWDEKGHQLGGYIWHTTGSGKTMTSFKSAHLIANSKDADKVVFLMDRVELGVQSLREYRAFADNADDIQGTQDTRTLISKLKSTDPKDTLIVTSIQKMSNISDNENNLNSYDLENIRSKRIVLIIDEAHRSTSGDMLANIKKTLPDAVFFGFTGTPIYDKNMKNDCTTSMIFGDELHRYTIADGIRDKNVLGFDPYKINTFKDKDLREAVALYEIKEDNIEGIWEDEKKKEKYYKFTEELPMATYISGEKEIKGIEDYIPKSQYDTERHRESVVKDIGENFVRLSRNYKFHGIFATESINEAIEYYRFIKRNLPHLKITALFDPHIDNNKGFEYKEDGLIEIMEDYNKTYNKNFSLPTHPQFKKDVSARLAHKKPYERIEKERESQLDLLIVVNQMLTGFDSKWVNTLYLDRVLEYDGLIQAFSRTNRIFGSDKRFGIIRYYRKPNTMEKNIAEAVKYYSGDREVDLFVQKLPSNLKEMNRCFDELKYIFEGAGIKNFERLPKDNAIKAKFASEYTKLNKFLDCAKVQGFTWDKKTYVFTEETDGEEEVVTVNFEKNDYNALLQRYKELATEKPVDSIDGDGGYPEVIPFDIDNTLIEKDAEKIDSDYMNSRFTKYIRDLNQSGVSQEELDRNLDNLHKSFASLSQEEQKFAKIFLHDIQSGDVQVESGKTFRDYITEYQYNAKNKEILELKELFDLDVEIFTNLLNMNLDEESFKWEQSEFNKLKDSVNKEKAKKYFEEQEGKPIKIYRVNIKIENFLKELLVK